jgi:hypothetical protein
MKLDSEIYVRMEARMRLKDSGANLRNRKEDS